MKLHKLAVALLFAGGMIGASASMASAETPFELTDCAVGYEAVLSEQLNNLHLCKHRNCCHLPPQLFEKLAMENL